MQSIFENRPFQNQILKSTCLVRLMKIMNGPAYWVRDKNVDQMMSVTEMRILNWKTIEN